MVDEVMAEWRNLPDGHQETRAHLGATFLFVLHALKARGCQLHDVSAAEVAGRLDTTEDEIRDAMPTIGLHNSLEMSGAAAEETPARCFAQLDINEETQKLASHIEEKVIVLENSQLRARRNPSHVSAAVIYIACSLENERRTQRDICKLFSVSEVTLRKVCNDLRPLLGGCLPAGYIPKVPVDRVFPSSKTSTPSTPQPTFVQPVPASGPGSAHASDDVARPEGGACPRARSPLLAKAAASVSGAPVCSPAGGVGISVSTTMVASAVADATAHVVMSATATADEADVKYGEVLAFIDARPHSLF
jgi:hypothetical protein